MLFNKIEIKESKDFYTNNRNKNKWISALHANNDLYSSIRIAFRELPSEKPLQLIFFTQVHTEFRNFISLLPARK